MRICNLFVVTAAVLLGAGCDAGKADEAKDTPQLAAAAVPAPNNGDWSTVVARTPEGGFLMGNPGAKVKLVEFGSLTCHVCADFEDQGGKPLVDNYVKKGLVSWEFRNFIRDPFDLTASLLARCGGEASFFGLTRNLYADQKEWVGKLQAAGPARLQSLQTMAPDRQFSTIADLGGLKQYASMRGVPREKAEQCLANQDEVNLLVQMTSDASATYSVTGTPTFLINGAVVERTHNWGLLEPRIKEALAS